MDKLLEIVQTINAYLSDYILIVLLIGVGIFYSIKTRFVQVRCFKQGMKQVFGNVKLNGGKQKKGMSSFQAFTTAVAAQVGTGNIIGASGAILAGGPGAIFWMWVIAFFGMATNYSEAVLAQKTRIVGDDGAISGGPIYYIKKAFKGGFGKFLAAFFAIATIIALGFVGCMVQSNSIAGAVNEATGVEPWIIGVVIVVLASIIFIGGVSRLASVTEKIVPIMAIVYLLGGLIIIACRITVLPEAFAMIFKYAFVPQAIIGGGIGAALKTAISQGAKRGLFSNEAGMGSTPHAHAQANVDTPHQQGISAMIGVFFDTFVVLTMTALIVITTLYAGDGMLSSPEKLAIATEGGNAQMVERNTIEVTIPAYGYVIANK
jgi:AGCS family alanine or glycine:cation symporter